MLESRLTFLTPTTLRLPKEVYATLFRDAWHFHYIKNERSNINGYLNDLLPGLAAYQNNSYELFNATAGVEYGGIAKSEKLFASFSQAAINLFGEEETVTVSFRVNQQNMNIFLHIHDVLLPKFDMSYTEFIRNLLMHYATYKLAIRERLLHYNVLSDLAIAVRENRECYIYAEQYPINQPKQLNPSHRLHCVPFSLVSSPYSGTNIILCFDNKKIQGLVLPLACVKKVILLDKRHKIEKKEHRLIRQTLNRFYEKEKQQTYIDHN